MKAIQLIKTTILALSFFFFSCSKHDEAKPNNSNPAGSSSFTAKVDGQSFPKTGAQFTTAKFVSSTRMLQIIGQPKDQKETIVLTLMPFGGKVTSVTDWKPGTYDFDPIHVTKLEYLASAEYNKYTGTGYDQWFTKWEYVKVGKIIIESNTGNHIKGSFQFDAVRKNTDGSFNASSVKKITEGKFDLAIKTL